MMRRTWVRSAASAALNLNLVCTVLGDATRECRRSDHQCLKSFGSQYWWLQIVPTRCPHNQPLSSMRE